MANMRVLRRLQFDPARDMQRLHDRDLWRAGGGAPGQEVRHGATVGPPGVRVSDLYHENSRKRAFRTGYCNQRWHSAVHVVDVDVARKKW